MTLDEIIKETMEGEAIAKRHYAKGKDENDFCEEVEMNMQSFLDDRAQLLYERLRDNKIDRITFGDAYDKAVCNLPD